MPCWEATGWAPNFARAARSALGSLALALLAACADPLLPGGSTASHPAGVVAAAPSLGSRPFGIAVNAAGTVYTTQLDNASISSASANTLTLGASVAVGNTPTAVAFNPAGTAAYVANQASSNIGVVDVASNAQVAQIAVTGNTFNVIVSPNGVTAYAATSSNQVHAIRISSRTVTGSVAVGPAPSAMTFGSGDTLLYVSSFVAGTVSEINVKGAMFVSREYILGGTPQGIAISPDQGTLYVANETGNLNVVDIATGTVSAPLNFGAAAFGLALSPDAAQLYATLPTVGVVAVVDRASLTLVKTITTGGTPRRVAFSADGLTAVVANEAGSVVFIR